MLFNKVGGQILSAEADLEPEYIAVSGGTAYVSLQEANAIAVVDIAAARIEQVLPLGFKDHSRAENAVDLNDEDGTYDPKTYENTYGVYMPDSIAVYEAGGRTYIVTANEGDAREWGKDDTAFCDEEKREGIAAADGTAVPNKVRVLDNAVKAGISADGNYLYGARSFSLFEVTDSGLTLAFDSASDFEAKTFAYLPDYYNASNDDADLESRTAKKGVEPEAVAVAELGGKAYAFIASNASAASWSTTSPIPPRRNTSTTSTPATSTRPWPATSRPKGLPLRRPRRACTCSPPSKCPAPSPRID